MDTTEHCDLLRLATNTRIQKCKQTELPPRMWTIRKRRHHPLYRSLPSHSGGSPSSSADGSWPASGWGGSCQEEQSEFLIFALLSSATLLTPKIPPEAAHSLMWPSAKTHPCLVVMPLVSNMLESWDFFIIFVWHTAPTEIHWRK